MQFPPHFLIEFLPQLFTHRYTNHYITMLTKCSPGRPWGEVLEPTSGHLETDLDFESILEHLGLPGDLLGGPWWYPFSPLDPSQGGPKEPEEPILIHLGRIPFWTLILDPTNQIKTSISRVPEP